MRNFAHTGKKETPLRIVTKVCTSVDIQDINTYSTFGDDRLRDLGVARGRISHFPIYLRHRPYNTLALECECDFITHTRSKTARPECGISDQY